MRLPILAVAFMMLLLWDPAHVGPAENERYLSDVIKNVSWLRDRIAPPGWALSGLVLASSSPDESRGLLYDQAMSLLAFSLFGLYNESSNIVARMKAVQNPDGSWFDQYDLKTGEPVENLRYTGANAWTVFVISFYARKFGDNSAKLVAKSAGDFLLRLQAENGGFYGGYRGNTPFPWKNVENNVAAYFAFSLLRQNIANETYSLARERVKSWLLTRGWNAEGRFNAGEADASLLLDAQSLGAIFLRQIDRVDRARTAVLYGQDKLLTHHRGFGGFKSRPTDDRVWFEGSLQMAVAYASLNDPIMAQRLIDEAVRASGARGGIPYFSDGRERTASTAWLVIAVASYCNMNPFIPDAVTGIRCGR